MYSISDFAKKETKDVLKYYLFDHNTSTGNVTDEVIKP